MFTGIVVAQGEVVTLEVCGARAAGGAGPRGTGPGGAGGDVALVIDASGLGAGRLAVGDSVSVEGVCLTATRIEGGGTRFGADVSIETLSKTTLGALVPGAKVNLEPALRAGDALGGHLVSGHVDGIGVLAAREPDARSWRFTFELPSALMRYVAPKGSICLNGVSLTVNAVMGDRFEVNLIPHTLEVTTLGQLVVGARVNVEVDLVARYLERLLSASGRLA